MAFIIQHIEVMKMMQNVKVRITLSKPGVWFLYASVFARYAGLNKIADKLSDVAVNNFLTIK